MTFLTHCRAEITLKRLQNSLHGLLGVLVGESLIVGSERQREGDGLHAVGNVRAGVDIKQCTALKILAAGLFDAVDELCNGDRFIANDGDVARDGGKTIVYLSQMSPQTLQRRIEAVLIR